MSIHKNRTKARIENNKGITLIALVVTIIVLIILATISINLVFNENGIIKKAQRAKEFQANGEASDQERIDIYDQHIANALAGKGGNSAGGDIPVQQTIKDKYSEIQTDTVTTQDDNGNKVVVPGGFKIAEDSGTNVQDGIVIEDESGNQFVWVPVSNINHDGTNPIVLKDESKKEITLGRYTFDSSTGAETKVQYGSEYAETTLAKVQAGEVDSYKADSYFYELTEFRESNYKDDLTGTNATAKDLKGFIESVRDNKGYYIARYEASYSSGSTFGVGNDSSYYKPASKKSTANSEGGMNYTEGTLWNFISQGNASKASRQMYYGNEFVESDLVNSYAWDTAIVYIQAMGNNNYANVDSGTNTSLLNTGETGDKKCKIFDMAGNLSELTTEYSTYTTSSLADPCTGRGGNYRYSSTCTGNRGSYYATDNYKSYSFRPLLYCKTGT